MVRLADVCYAPDFVKHILSLRKLIDVGWHAEKADKAEFVVQHSNGRRQLRFERDTEDHLSYLKCARTQSTETGGPTVMIVVSVTATTMGINVAHSILSHPDGRTLRTVAKKLKWTPIGAFHPCGACALTKAKAKVVPKSTQTRATKPGERLFLDISGPSMQSMSVANQTCSALLMIIHE